MEGLKNWINAEIIGHHESMAFESMNGIHFLEGKIDALKDVYKHFSKKEAIKKEASVKEIPYPIYKKKYKSKCNTCRKAWESESDLVENADLYHQILEEHNKISPNCRGNSIGTNEVKEKNRPVDIFHDDVIIIVALLRTQRDLFKRKMNSKHKESSDQDYYHNLISLERRFVKILEDNLNEGK